MENLTTIREELSESVESKKHLSRQTCPQLLIPPKARVSRLLTMASPKARIEESPMKDVDMHSEYHNRDSSIAPSFELSSRVSNPSIFTKA